MTIDEAIAHAREVAAIQRNNDKLNKTLGVISPYYKTDCIKCAEEHEQLKEWLEELKVFREISKKNPFIIDMIKHDKIVRNKAIDDFVNACKEDILCQSFGLHANGIERIAEQLKAGGIDGNERTDT